MVEPEELCDHGKPFDGKCEPCQKEYWETIRRIQTIMGKGDRKRGARLLGRLFDGERLRQRLYGEKKPDGD